MGNKPFYMHVYVNKSLTNFQLL